MATRWQPIEKLIPEAIWVLKYDMWQKDGNFCEPHTEGAEKFTSCHGWYRREQDAQKVQRHFQNPTAYRIEKVWKRELMK